MLLPLGLYPVPVLGHQINGQSRAVFCLCRCPVGYPSSCLVVCHLFMKIFPVIMTTLALVVLLVGQARAWEALAGCLCSSSLHNWHCHFLSGILQPPWDSPRVRVWDLILFSLQSISFWKPISGRPLYFFVFYPVIVLPSRNETEEPGCRVGLKKLTRLWELLDCWKEKKPITEHCSDRILPEPSPIAMDSGERI